MLFIDSSALANCMLDFANITLETLKQYKQFTVPNHIKLCDYTPGCMALWGDYSSMQICIKNNMLFGIACYDNALYYTLPVGDGSLDAALNEIEIDAKERNIPIRFCAIPKEYINVITTRFPSINRVGFEIKWSDYLYPYDNFCGYHGNALHGQRNHVNRFKKEHPNYAFIPMTSENIYFARQFMIENRSIFDKDVESAEAELNNLHKIFEAYEVLSLHGGFLMVEGRVLGFTIGEPCGDTLHVHVEKALTEFSGAYQVLAMCFAEHMKSDSLIYINRQDDAGDEGLRRSKETYKPCAMLEKYKLETV